MNKFKIALDVDGVLRDFDGKLQQVYRSVYPTSRMDEVTDWDLHHFYGIGKEIYSFAFHSTWTKVIFEYADMYEGALEFYNSLVDLEDVEVRIYTHQHKDNYVYTLNWLLKNGFNRTSIVFEEDKVSDLWWDLIIDDKLDTILRSLDDLRLSIRVDRPWNRKHQSISKFTKTAYNYADILRFVKEFKDR